MQQMVLVMVQILEVLIAVVISAMMATAISTLALTPIKTQRQKSIYAASEAAAIAVRKCVVDNPAAITVANVRDLCVVPILSGSTDVECSARIPYTPPGSSVSVPNAVVCNPTGAAAGSSGEAWQPLYKP
jgi:type II secretory pathway pseudopilin PulG